MHSLLGVISDMTYNKQSESTKREMATVTGDTEQVRILHTVASVGIETVDGKMPKGEEKEIHTVACVGVIMVDGRMPEGKEKNKHVEAGEGGVTSKKGKMTEGNERDEHSTAISDCHLAVRMRLLQFLNQNRGGECQQVAARKSLYEVSREDAEPFCKKEYWYRCWVLLLTLRWGESGVVEKKEQEENV
jgi:hypothetical protein